MRKFYALTYFAHRNYLMSVVDYEMADFDSRSLWRSVPVSFIPENVKLFVDFEYSADTDYVGNPLSWCICSLKLAEKIKSLCNENEVHFINAPLYDVKSGIPVGDYYIMQVLKEFYCIDKEKSVIRWSEDKTYIAGIFDTYICDKNVPKEVNIFRSKELKAVYFVSKYFFDSLRSFKKTGLNFSPMNTSY